MANSPEYKYDVFISHSSDDSDYCFELTEKLEKDMKKKCFMYERDLHGNLIEAITSTIRESRRILLVITKNFLESKWGIFETQEAIHKCHKERVVALIPILHEVDPKDCPPYLKHYRYYETKDPEFLTLLKGAIEEDRSVTTLIPAGDVAHGLCWSYYYGFLKLVLPGISERCKIWHDERKKVGWLSQVMSYIGLAQIPKTIPMLKKMVIVIPSTCYCPNSLNSLDPEHFTHSGFIEYQATRAGNIKRDYKSSVFTVKDPETKEEFLFISEFATPLLSMYEMEQERIAGLSKEQMDHQRMLFVQKLQEILWHPSNTACHHKASILEYDNEGEDKSKQLAALLCNHIRKELKAQREMEDITEMMSKMITDKTSHD